jgi:hypothetical protein
MDEQSEFGQSGSVVRDRYDADTWRVYFQGQLTAPVFIGRNEAISYLSALKMGYQKPEFAKAYKGKEVRRETSHR